MMTKKTFAVATLVFMMIIGMETAYAQIPSDLFSFGGGLLFDGGRVGNFLMPERRVVWWDDATGEMILEYTGRYWDDRTNRRSVGAWGFVDATFAELSIGFMGGPQSIRSRLDGGNWEESLAPTLIFALDIALLGKFPIGLPRVDITVSPLLGFGYNIVLSQRGPGGSSHPEPSRLNTFRIKGGVGGDFDLSERLFYRVSVLGAYRFLSRANRDWASLSGRNDASGGFGVIVKVGLGVRL